MHGKGMHYGKDYGKMGHGKMSYGKDYGMMSNTKSKSGKQVRAGKGTIRTPFSRAILRNVGRGR